MNTRINRTLLVAAAILGAASSSKAYDMIGSNWNYRQPSNSQSFTQGGDLNSTFYGISMESRLVDAGVFRGVYGEFSWSNNVYGGGSWDYAAGSVGTDDGTGGFDYGFDGQNAVLANGTFNFDSGTNTAESTNIAIGQRYAGIFTQANGDSSIGVYRSVTVYERNVQVARTGSGNYGADAFTAFESDNTATPSAAYYNGTTFVGRNVLPFATGLSTVNVNYATASFVNGSFEINTAVSTEWNLDDAVFNSKITGVVVTCQPAGNNANGESDIIKGSSVYFGAPPDGNTAISITAENDRVDLALTSSLTQGETYNLKFDFNYSNQATNDSPLFVYGSSTAGSFDTLLYTINSGSTQNQWLTANFTFVAGANINFIGLAGDQTLVNNSWIALDNFRFEAGSGVSTSASDLAGSVVRLGDIALGFGDSEGLYSKDGGWLDIRGDLTLGSLGTIYIRDGEITANTYTQSYTPGTNNVIGVLTIESGILSVRQRFAQDMVATWGQTLGLRDGAVNDTRLLISGYGYGFNFDGEGGTIGPVGSTYGAFRSITGNNIQNGNISLFTDGEGANGAIIGTDLGSTLTINGNINGLNSLDSQGGVNLGYFSEGQTIQNGNILAGVDEVLKRGAGELLFNSANSFTGDAIVDEGSLRITHSGSLSGTSGDTYVSSGASLVLDQAAGLSLAEDIHITGTGQAGVGGAIHNKAGANVTTGNLWIDSPDSLNASATATVAASSSLTVANLRTNGSYDTFTIDVSGADATAGSFTVVGDTGSLDVIIKNGTGLATLTTLTNDVDTITVNAGKVVVLGSASTLLAPFSTDFTKNGSSVLEVRGSHFYEDFNVDAGTVDLFGNLSLAGYLDGGDYDLNGSSILNVESGATLTHISDGEGGPYTNGMDINDTAALNVKVGGIVQLNATEIDLDDSGTVTIGGVLSTTDGIYVNDSATLRILSGGILNGNVYLSSGTFDGKGRQNGNLVQTGGLVAPGQSVGILSVSGNYSNVGGTLDLELAGTGGAGAVDGNDQLRVSGSITVSNLLPVDYSVINFVDINGFEAKHGNVFQVIAFLNGATRNTFDKFDLSQAITSANDRVLFDHSTGRAYGTGLINAQNFKRYGNNQNQREIGRALWMEAIDYDKSGITGELPQSFINSAYDSVAAAAKTGRKAWILTTHDAVLGELSTELGAAAIQMLTAASGAEGLDSLSPEAYSGFGELATRLNRNFALLGATGRRTGDDNKWGFNVGYSGEQVTSDSTSAYTSYEASSDTSYLTADLALGANVHLNLSAGMDNGSVKARDFNGDADAAIFGIGLGITSDNKFIRFDIGTSFSSTDFSAVRQGSYMKQDNQDAYAVALRLTFLPEQPSVNAAAQAAKGTPSKFTVIPYVGVSYANTDVDTFSEADIPETAQLNVKGFNRRSLIGELGLNAEYAIGDATTLTGVLAYEHEFHESGRTEMTAEFADDGVDDTDFTIHTDGLGSDIFRIGVGLRQGLGSKASFGISYDALLGGGVTSGQHFKADVSFRF